jgi:hypothetical protein
VKFYFLHQIEKEVEEIWIFGILELMKMEHSRIYNCGIGVNTLGDEVTPFYDARDSLLYFSSEWHKSLGGFDVFSIKRKFKTDKWSAAVNGGKTCKYQLQ